jgi:hypothetical protein
MSEAVLHVQGLTPVAGRRPVGISLFEFACTDWLTADHDAAPLRYLPSNL